MKSYRWGTLLAAMLLVAVSAPSAQISIGIRIGPPPPPRVVRILPPRPAPEFIWVEGYWYPVERHYKWHEGYWTRPPYEGAHWVSPHHDGEQFFPGYWDGERGRMEHQHRWDHDRDRDFHEHDRDRDRDRDHGERNRD
jgi:hypothetical protein